MFLTTTIIGNRSFKLHRKLKEEQISQYGRSCVFFLCFIFKHYAKYIQAVSYLTRTMTRRLMVKYKTAPAKTCLFLKKKDTITQRPIITPAVE